MANIWDPQRGVWVDDQTGNTFKPVDQGGDGIWHSPDGKSYINGQWVGGQQQATQPIPGTNLTAPANASGGFNGLAGSDYYKAAQGQQFTQTNNTQQQQATSALHASDEAAATARQNSLNAVNLQIQQLTNEKDLEVAKGNNASTERIAQLTYQVGMLNAQANMLTAQVNKDAEARQERALQAQLAANPQDFVAYEYYKRALGNPSTLGAASPQTSQQTGGTPMSTTPGTNSLGTGPGWSNGYAEGSVSSDGKWMIQNGAVVPNTSGGAGSSGNTPGASGLGTNSVATPSIAPTSNMLNGGSYSPAPPAYDNNTLAGVLAGIQTPGQSQWNPALSGQSAFGGQINAPNTLGRNTYGNLSDADKGILTSFLNAGVNMNGQQVSLDPNEYFQQMQKSWVPTLQGGTGQNTQYSE